MVIWSHGLGGSRDGAGFLGRYISSHGYIVIHLTHIGTDTSLWEGKPGHPWDAIRATKISRKTTLERFKDVPFFLNNISSLDLYSLMDTERIGMSGHSFGAITTQIMAGQKLGIGKRKYSLKDNRFKAGILYSPSITYNHEQPHNEIYGPLAIPLFHITGTDDYSPVRKFPYTERLKIYNHATGPDQHLLILNDADHMVFVGSRGGLGASTKRDIHEKILKISSLAFWETYLKENDNAKEWLMNGKFAEWLNGEGTYKHKN